MVQYYGIIPKIDLQQENDKKIYKFYFIITCD